MFTSKQVIDNKASVAWNLELDRFVHTGDKQGDDDYDKKTPYFENRITFQREHTNCFIIPTKYKIINQTVG